MYVILAILGLSFLVFIHELGHYLMARRVGMRVETFSIGFGRPIVSWMRQGVKWQIGWLPFGGYVKIAGSEFDKDKDPYAVSDGFFGKGPLARIKVAFMGPFVNLVFAFLVFFCLWLSNGREKNFSEFTTKIGWVDPDSQLYQLGVRPGDEIIGYNDQSFQGAKDHLYVPMTSSDPLVIHGNKVDYSTQTRTPFSYSVKPYPLPAALDKGILTGGITNSGTYIIYNRLANGSENPMQEGSPLQSSGIQYGDRLLWVDGEVIFSLQELSHLLSGQRILLTVQRGDKFFLARVPRVQVGELKPNSEFREEMIDWQFAANLNQEKFQNLYVIPYNLTNACVVEEPLKFIDKEKEEEIFPASPFSPLEMSLKAGDKIVAIAGVPVTKSYDLLRELQTFHVNVIVQRDPAIASVVDAAQEDTNFDQEVNWKQLQEMAVTLGTPDQVTHLGDLVLLKPIEPKLRSQFDLSAEKQALLTTEILAQKKAIEAIEDPEKRNQARKLFDAQEKRLLLGLPGIQDKKVNYNPTPIELFENVFNEIARTLYALVSGQLNPKWISGPIGIVQVVQSTASSSIKEAVFWLGAISLNLGLLNLLPIPVLDGGTIVLSFFELITRKKIDPKSLEKLIIPFSILLIGFFIFLTYNDLSRLLSHLWPY